MRPMAEEVARASNSLNTARAVEQNGYHSANIHRSVSGLIYLDLLWIGWIEDAGGSGVFEDEDEWGIWGCTSVNASAPA